MGLFHNKCTALVDAATGVALTGAELVEAKEQQQKGMFASHTLANGRKWKVCGHSVSKKARVCSKCGSRAPGGWVKCPVCHEWIGNESHFCPHCNHPIHPEERIDFAGGIWDHDAGLFAQRFEIEDAAKILKEGIHIQEGTVAILLDSGKESGILGPGRHDPDGTLRKINWFGNPPPRSVVMVDSGDIVLKLDFDGLHTADETVVRMVAEVTLRFVPSRADDFIQNVFKDTRRSISYDEVTDILKSECEYAASNLCVKSNVEDLVKDPQRRETFEDELSRTLRDLLRRMGLELVRVGAVDFISADYEELRGKYGDLEKSRRQFEFDQKLMELAAQKETALFADEHAEIERSNEDTEFRAKKEQELWEYIEQLAQEKGLSEIDRKEEMAIFKLVSAGKISAQEAELSLAELQQGHAQQMAELANKLELDMTLSNYDRDEQMRQAEQKAKLADVDRAEAEKNASSEIVVYGAKVVGAAKAEQEARRLEIDTDIYEADKWVDIQRKKQDVETDRLKELRAIDRDIDETKMKARAQEFANAKGASIEALIATADDPEKMKALVEVARVNIQKGMSADQLLATAAATSDAAANAIAAKTVNEKDTLERLVDEIKKLAGDNSAKDERLLSTLAQVMGRAAERPDAPPPPPAPTQQIIK